MTKPDLRLPEPTLPEHTLISESAPIPELSAGFKTRVMVDCIAGIAQAKKVRRWKMAGAATVFCCLGLVVCLTIPNEPERQFTEQQPQPQVPVGPDHSLGYSSTLGMDQAVPPVGKDVEDAQMNQVIESFENRQKRMLDANFMPPF